MHDQPRGPLSIPDEVIQFETGRPSAAWHLLLDASGARAFSHAQLIGHLGCLRAGHALGEHACRAL
ncbi:MAG: hypothetical protein IPM07_22430 [Anaerolineales bacterium]|nr:hypothetical protein [Anaerolineales bacterium]